MTGLESAYPTEVAEILAKYPVGASASAAVELLYLAQAHYGHLTGNAIADVAELVALEPTQVRGLVGFYSLLYDEPQGGFVVHLCTDLPCALRGAERIRAVLVEALGCDVGDTSDDGLFTLHECMCLAACDRAPVAQVNLEYFYDLTPELVHDLVADLRRRADGGLARRPPFGYGPPSEAEAS